VIRPVEPGYGETMVNLTRIYTRTGDDGTTALGDMSRTRKTDTRLAAYADVDETNAAIGLALALGGQTVSGVPEELSTLLLRIQNELFDLGADLCTPIVENPEFPPLRIEQEYIDRLEAACDEYNAVLDKLRSFILNGGTVVAAQLHVARTVARRAERSTWAAIEEYGDGINPLAVKYLNRLSDLLFILARVANTDSHGGEGDVLWVPGGNRG
jgi:cob(I)alamin adenosyltransferase